MRKVKVNGKWIYPEPEGKKVLVLREGQRHPRAKGRFIKNDLFEKQVAVNKYRQDIKR
jgi:hypothetical protein